MDVFVYGTLTAPEQVREVLDSFVFVGPATLEGCHLVEGRYPTLAPGGETAGRLLRTDESGLAALDAYEGVDDGLYVRVAVPLRAPEELASGNGTDAGNGGGGSANTENGGDGADGGNGDNGADRSAYPDQAAVYVGDPDRLDADATWPGEGAFGERVRRTLAADGRSVRVRVERER